MAPRGLVAFATGVTAMAVLFVAYLHTGRLRGPPAQRPILAPSHSEQPDGVGAAPLPADVRSSAFDLGIASHASPASDATGKGGGGDGGGAGGGGGGGKDTRVLAPAGRICCKAMTAQCMSCAAGVKLAEFCKTHASTPGCPIGSNEPKPKPGDASPALHSCFALVQRILCLVLAHCTPLLRSCISLANCSALLHRSCVFASLQ
jgi:hypothetical protein